MTLRRHWSAMILWTIVGLVVIAPFAGCSDGTPITVTSYYGPGMKFSGLGSTFAWMPSPPEPGNQPEALREFRQLFRTSVERHLAAKGFTPGPAASAGFLLDFRLGKQEKTDSGVNPHGEVFDEGSLVLDVVNPKSNELIWRGVAQARMNYSYPPDVREKRINIAVQELMKKFPPK